MTSKTFGKFTAEISRNDDRVLCDVSQGRHSASLALCEDLGTIGEEPGAPSISEETLEAITDWALEQGY